MRVAAAHVGNHAVVPGIVGGEVFNGESVVGGSFGVVNRNRIERVVGSGICFERTPSTRACSIDGNVRESSSTKAKRNEAEAEGIEAGDRNSIYRRAALLSQGKCRSSDASTCI